MKAQKTDSSAPQLKIEKRKITGRKVKTLRREGILPANIYGKNIKSLAAQVDLKPFLLVYAKEGETGLVELKIANEEKTRPVLIHNVQLDPVTDSPIHVDFYQVDLTKTVTAEVPIELVGEAPAVKDKIGILIQSLTEVEVEALPAGLPDKLTVDVSSLKAVDELVKVGDLKPPKGVKILTDAGLILVKIEPPAKEEEVAPPTPPAGEEETPTKEKPEEAKPAEGEKKVEEKKPEGAPKEEKPQGKPKEEKK